MILALLSDSHDNEPATRTALALLRPYHPDVYLHAGDLVSPHMLAFFTGLPFHFVFGNNEYDHAGLRSRALAESVRCHDKLAQLTFDGKNIALLHGHESTDMQHLIHSERFHYLIHGHTHVRRDERIGATRIINPGALHRARIHSVALLNLADDSLKFLELP